MRRTNSIPWEEGVTGIVREVTAAWAAGTDQVRKRMVTAQAAEVGPEQGKAAAEAGYGMKEVSTDWRQQTPVKGRISIFIFRQPG